MRLRRRKGERMDKLQRPTKAHPPIVHALRIRGDARMSETKWGVLTYRK